MARAITGPTGADAVPLNPKPLLRLRGDDHLVRQARLGNEAAFEVIYERHVPGILSFCRHMLGSLEEAEDAVQHAFAGAYRDLMLGQREINLKPWLYTIARNRCLSILRARREDPDETLDGRLDGLDDEVQRRAELRELLADLHDLPSDQRAALVLFELGDLSHAEVAEALGCELANVKGLVFRARSGLIERRDARDASCEEIQQELATARNGAYRRSRLRHHLRTCSACSDYRDQVRVQRKMMAVVLPVVPTVGLKNGALAGLGIGGASGGGGAAAGGLLASSLPTTCATVAKVAVIGAVVAGAGAGGTALIKGSDSPHASQSAVSPKSPGKGPRSPVSVKATADRGAAAVAAGERRTLAVKSGSASVQHGQRDGGEQMTARGEQRENEAAADVPGKPGHSEPHGQIRREPSAERLPTRVDPPEPPRLPVRADPLDPARLPARIETPDPARLPVGGDVPDPTRLPVRADPPDLPAACIGIGPCR